MGLQVNSSLLCDKDGVTTASLESADAPVPDGWMRVSGYANISNGVSAPLDSYFCPACIAAYGTRDLVKRAADLAADLTAVPA